MSIPSVSEYFDIMGLAQKSYGRLLTPICTEHDLTRNALDVLLFLHNNPRYDRAADIVAYRGMTKSHVSLSVSTLESRGLLLRQFDETDRRTAHLVLTEEGLTIAKQARTAQKQFFASIYQGIPAEELARWSEIMKAIHINIRNLDQTLTNNECDSRSLGA